MRGKYNIALALSGGGMRATLFHLGVLTYLAERNLLECVTDISTVSAGSLTIGLILSKNKYVWPSSEDFLNRILPFSIKTIFTHDLQQSIECLKKKYPECDVSILFSKVLRDKWGIYGNLQDLCGVDWLINAVSYETAESFVFSKNYMGGKSLGYTFNPSVQIDKALAASGAYPELIGGYLLDMKPYKWYEDLCGKQVKCKPRKFIHLWDGGVYDNLGLKSIYQNINRCYYIIVSDATLPTKEEEWSTSPIERLSRVWEIDAKELNKLSVCDFIDCYVNRNRGKYLSTSMGVCQILECCHIKKTISDKLIEDSLSQKEVEYVLNYPTTLSTPNLEDLFKIIRHGYEVAKASSYCK